MLPIHRKGVEEFDAPVPVRAGAQFEYGSVVGYPPPPLVVPYRFPAASKINAAHGFSPSPGLPEKEWRIFSVHFPFASGVSSKTMPQPPAPQPPPLPPSPVVPYSRPSESKITPARGSAPSAGCPEKLCSTVSVQVPFALGAN